MQSCTSHPFSHQVYQYAFTTEYLEKKQKKCEIMLRRHSWVVGCNQHWHYLFLMGMWVVLYTLLGMRYELWVRNKELFESDCMLLFLCFSIRVTPHQHLWATVLVTLLIAIARHLTRSSLRGKGCILLLDPSLPLVDPKGSACPVLHPPQHWDYKHGCHHTWVLLMSCFLNVVLGIILKSSCLEVSNLLMSYFPSPLKPHS